MIALSGENNPKVLCRTPQYFWPSLHLQAFLASGTIFALCFTAEYMGGLHLFVPKLLKKVFYFLPETLALLFKYFTLQVLVSVTIPKVISAL